MGVSDDISNQHTENRVKVARLLDQYALPGVGEELEEFWTADGKDRKSLRDLAEYFNLKLLSQVLDEAGIQPLDGELVNLYRLLTSEDVGSGDKTRAIRRLERNGVDVDRLTDDFVTYQAIRTYLKKHRNAEYSPSQPSPSDRKGDLQRLQGRVTKVTECTINKLKKSDEFDLGNFSTIVSTTIICDDCGNSYEVGSLLEQGGCECSSS